MNLEALLMEERNSQQKIVLIHSPLVYIPSTGNLVFSGTIPAMNNLKWQFSLKDSDGTGLFIWVEG